MIAVAICDDNAQERYRIEQFIQEYSYEHGIKMMLYTYDSGEDMNEKLQDIHFDIVFLDIYMKQMTGIDLAKRIREKSETSIIIFTTSSAEHALEAYRFRAFQYLLKPIELEEVRKVMKYSIQHLQPYKGVEHILPIVDGVRKVNLDDIYYIESSVRKTIIHFKEESCVCIYNINTLETKLSSYGFVRCHRSFIVNLNKVKMLRQSELELNNDAIVFLSKYKQKEVKKQLVDYCGGIM